jgi:hypothetical protein
MRPHVKAWTAGAAMRLVRAGADAVDTPQGSGPLGFVDDRLGDISGHRRQIHLERGQVSRVAVNPAHAFGSRLRTRDVERCLRGIDTGHLQAAFGQQQREGAGPAADIEYAAGADLVSDVDVHIEIASVRVERVVDRRQPRVLEDVVSHVERSGRR